MNATTALRQVQRLTRQLARARLLLRVQAKKTMYGFKKEFRSKCCLGCGKVMEWPSDAKIAKMYSYDGEVQLSPRDALSKYGYVATKKYCCYWCSVSKGREHSKSRYCVA